MLADQGPVGCCSPPSDPISSAALSPPGARVCSHTSPIAPLYSVCDFESTIASCCKPGERACFSHSWLLLPPCRLRISLGLKPLTSGSAAPKPAPAAPPPKEDQQPSAEDIRAKLAAKRSRRR